MVSISLLLFAALWAVDAGRAHENGTGAMRIAPELVARHLPVQGCSQTASLAGRELVFETLDPSEIDADLPRLMASSAREVVNFEWNAATGELGFSTHSTTAIFSDLATSSRVSSPSTRSCGSR